MKDNISLFYKFSSKLSGNCFQASPNFDTGLNWDVSDLIKGKYEKFNFPIIFKQDGGEKLYDLLDTGFISLYLISEKFKNLLIKYNFTGWKSYPISMYNKKGIVIDGYSGFSVIGTSGKIDYTKSKIIEKSTVPNGPVSKYYIGEYFGLDEWDGSDFFIPKGHHRINCTMRVKEVLLKEKITHLRLVNLMEIEIWEKAIKDKV